MTPQSSTRETRRVQELASEYERKGFDVKANPSRDDVPAFLQTTGYVPDLIARSEESNFIVEVKTQQTTASLSRIVHVSEIVNAQPGWQFVLVLTNPRQPGPSLTVSPSATKVRDYLQKVDTLSGNAPAHLEAAFVFAWSAVEGALRLLAKHADPKTASNLRTMIRNAAMHGEVDRRSAQDLEQLLKVRNSILHAGDAAPPTRADVAFLRRIAEELITENRPPETGVLAND